MAEIKTVKAVIQGQTYNLTYNSTSQKWECSITAPSVSSFNQEGGFYDVSITAEDNAGNSDTINSNHATLGNSCRLEVIEKVAPTVSIISPGANAYITNNKPSITVQIRDNDSGVDISKMVFKIDSEMIAYNAAGMDCTPVSDGYNVTYSCQNALAEGSHTISVAATDNDGNTCTAVTRSFKIDTVPPVLNVTSPTDGLNTNSMTGTVIGTTNDATSSPVTVSIKVNNIDAGTVTVEANGNFNKAINYVEGANTVEVTATDAAGKTSTTTITVFVDTEKPQFESVEIIPNPVDAGATYVIKVKVK